MNKDSKATLKAVYDDILGPGDDVGEEKKTIVGDEAYKEEDYTGESTEDGVDDIDPREEEDLDDAEEEDEEDNSDESDEDSEESPEGEDSEEDDEAEERFIPDSLVEAGRRAGLTDDEIIELDATNPALLDKFISSKSSQEQKIVVPDAKETEEKKREALKKLNIDVSLLELDENTASAITPMQETLNKLVDRITELEGELGSTAKGVSELSKSQEAEFSKQIDGFFDSKVKQVPAFGMTKTATKEQQQARIEAWEVAKSIHNGSGGEIGIDKALEISVNAIKGGGDEKRVKKGIVKELTNSKKRFTSRPRGGRKKGKEKRTEEQRAVAAINEVLDSPDY